MISLSVPFAHSFCNPSTDYNMKPSPCLEPSCKYKHAYIFLHEKIKITNYFFLLWNGLCSLSQRNKSSHTGFNDCSLKEIKSGELILILIEVAHSMCHSVSHYQSWTPVFDLKNKSKYNNSYDLCKQNSSLNLMPYHSCLASGRNLNLGEIQISPGQNPLP